MRLPERFEFRLGNDPHIPAIPDIVLFDPPNGSYFRFLRKSTTFGPARRMALVELATGLDSFDYEAKR